MKKIIFILLFLIIILALMVFVRNQNTESESALIINLQGKSNIRIDFSDYQPESISTSRGELSDCYHLPGMFRQNNIALASLSRLHFFSEDGARITIGADEFDQIYLQYTVKDKPEIRLIIPDDDFSQRWLKHINRIESDAARN